MPLMQGCSVRTAILNYKKLLRDGRDSEQAYVVALNIARKYRDRCNFKRRVAIVQGRLFENE